MSASQIFFYVAIIVVAAIYVRQLLIRRSIVQYDAGSVSAKLKAKENIVLLDVRTSAERSRRHIPGSVHMPLHELKGRIGELEKFKVKEIVCYCQSGSRSLSAANILKHQGFRVANLSGGISSWMS